MRCVVLDRNTWKVVNVISADVSFDPGPDLFLVQITSNVEVDTNYHFAGGYGFLSPISQRYFVLSPGAALPKPVEYVRSVIHDDIDKQSELHKSLSDSPVYQQTLENWIVSLKQEVSNFDFPEIVHWEPHDWPVP